MIKLTKKATEALEALSEPGRYLLTRNESTLAPGPLREALTGTQVIELVDGEEVSILVRPMQCLSVLVKGGYLDNLGPCRLNGTLYCINDKGRELLAANKRPPKRISREEVEALAEKHGCAIKRVAAREWFELERLDGQPLKNSIIAYKPGSPDELVRLYSDLTLEEWEQAIKQASKVKRAKART